MRSGARSEAGAPRPAALSPEASADGDGECNGDTPPAAGKVAQSLSVPAGRMERADSSDSLNLAYMHSLGLDLDRRSSSRHRSVTIASHDLDAKRRYYVKDGLSAEAAMVNLIKGLLGTGLLGLPTAFKNAGLYGGLVLTIVMCTINVYCMQMLVEAAHHLCRKFRKTSIDYANVARYATMVGPAGLHRHCHKAKFVVNGVLFTAQFGACCVYFVFMAQNMKQVADHWWPGGMFSQRVWIAIFLLPELALALVRTLRALAPISLMANACYICGCLAVLVYLVNDHLDSWTLPAFAPVRTLPLAFGTVMFAFEGVPLVLPIENRCYDAKFFIHPLGVLNTSCYLVIAVYCAVGFFGYLKKGDTVMDTVSLDLPLEPWYNAAAKVCFVLAMSGTYALMFYVPLERMELYVKRHYLADKGKWRRQLWYSAMRVALVLVTFLVAEAVPHLDLFMSLVGSFCGSFMTLVIPACISLLIIYDKGKLRTYRIAPPCFVIAVGIAGFCIGTYYALHDIYVELMSISA